MKVSINLDSKDIRRIIAKYLEIDESSVIPNRYSFSVTDITIEELQKKLEDSNSPK